MPRTKREWVHASAMVWAWVEKVGYCYHTPIHTDSDECRRQRHEERAQAEKAMPQKRAVYTGQPDPARKLNW